MNDQEPKNTLVLKLQNGANKKGQRTQIYPYYQNTLTVAYTA